MNEYIKKYTGGIALMFSVLFLLIGLTKYDQIFTEFKNNTSGSIAYVKTAIFQSNEPSIIEKLTFSLESDGDIMKIINLKDDVLTYHYRALSVPALQNNYDLIPKLQLETIVGDEKKMLPTDIYKIDREKGLLYFLLKIEKNHQVVLSDFYTGNYIVTFIN